MDRIPVEESWMVIQNTLNSKVAQIGPSILKKSVQKELINQLSCKLFFMSKFNFYNIDEILNEIKIN